MQKLFKIILIAFINNKRFFANVMVCEKDTGKLGKAVIPREQWSDKRLYSPQLHNEWRKKLNKDPP